MREVEELRYLILAAQREGNRALAQALRPLGLTPSQAEVLRVLEDKGPLSLNRIGELLVCESGNNPSRLVDRLVKAGLAERRPSTTDGRSITVALTRSGTDLAARIRDIEEGLYGLIDAAMPATQRGHTVRALRSLVDGTLAGEAVRRRT